MCLLLFCFHVQLSHLNVVVFLVSDIYSRGSRIRYRLGIHDEGFNPARRRDMMCWNLEMGGTVLVFLQIVCTYVSRRYLRMPLCTIC